MRRLQLVVMGTLVVIVLMIAYKNGASAVFFSDGFSTSKTPITVQVEDGTFNLQIQALELTQGVRGQIPSRAAPAADLRLPSDGAVHVADRRTVVRAYPWVDSLA